MGNTYRRGSESEREERELDIDASYDGTAELSVSEEDFRAGQRVRYDSEEHEFPSYHQAQGRARELQVAWEGEGFALVEPRSFGEARAPKNARWVPGVLVADFDLAQGRSPHTSNRQDLGAIFAHEHFPGCSEPPVHILTLDLSAIGIFPASIRSHGAFHIFYSNHESCDAWMLNHPDWSGSLFLRRHERAGMVAVEGFDAYPTSCSREPPEKSPARSQVWDVLLWKEDDHWLLPPMIQVGGEPPWWQSNDWPDCPECEREMFFIVSIRAISVPPGDGCGDQLLNAFLCERCGRQATVMQMT